jgi:hypothetical protein
MGEIGGDGVTGLPQPVRALQLPAGMNNLPLLALSFTLASLLLGACGGDTGAQPAPTPDAALGADAAAKADTALAADTMVATDTAPTCGPAKGAYLHCFKSSMAQSYAGTITGMAVAPVCEQAGGAMSDADVLTVRLDDGRNAEVQVGHDLPLPLKVGDAIEVAYNRGPSFQYRPAFTVKKGGAIIIHAQQQMVPELPSPVKLEMGAAVCENSDSCGSWTVHALVAGSGPTVTIAPDGSGDVGGYRVYNAGVKKTSVAPGALKCPDWDASSFAAVLVKLP